MPVLGEPTFEAAVQKVMEESDVPRENAERIVGSVESKKNKKSKYATLNAKLSILSAQMALKKNKKT